MPAHIQSRWEFELAFGAVTIETVRLVMAGPREPRPPGLSSV